MRRLEEDEGPRVLAQLLDATPPLSLFPRKKPLEREPVRREAGDLESAERAGGTRHGNDREAFRHGGADKRERRIGDARRAGVGDDRHGSAAAEPGDQLGRAGVLVVVVVGDHGAAGAEAIEETGRVPGVFGGEHVHRGEDPLGSGGKVLYVSDRRADEVENAGRRLRGGRTRAHGDAAVPAKPAATRRRAAIDRSRASSSTSRCATARKRAGPPKGMTRIPSAASASMNSLSRSGPDASPAITILDSISAGLTRSPGVSAIASAKRRARRWSSGRRSRWWRRP